jgi:hypothetical protein
MPTGYTGEEITLTHDGSIPDTLTHIARISNDYASQVLDESAELEGNTDRETALNIWHFVRDNIQYQEDSEDGSVEILRRPARILFDGVGDCDCATILISAILKNLDIPHYYKTTAYEEIGEFQHIYPVMIDRQTGKHIAIDFVPEVPKPIYELPYIDKEIYNPQNGKIMRTEELGCAVRDPNIKYMYELELPPPPPLNFQNQTMAPCQDLEHYKTLNVLEYIKNVTQAVPPTSAGYEQAQAENQLVKIILQDPDNQSLHASLENVQEFNTFFAPVYSSVFTYTILHRNDFLDI